MATHYDPALIQKFADKLYAQARNIVAVFTLLGIIIGCLAGLMVGDRGTYAIIGGIIVGSLGFAMGQTRAFTLRLQAQIALCQVKIEENTRGGIKS